MLPQLNRRAAATVAKAESGDTSLENMTDAFVLNLAAVDRVIRRLDVAVKVSSQPALAPISFFGCRHRPRDVADI